MSKILTTGEKVRLIRKHVKLTQKQLAGKKLDISSISNIERNKTKLTYANAEFISKKINKVATSKEIYFSFVVSAQWLLESIDLQVEKYFKILQNEFNENILLECLNATKENNLKEKYIDILFFATKYYYFENKYKVSRKYALKALEENLEPQYILKFNSYISSGYIEEKNFIKALKYNTICHEIIFLYFKDNEEYINSIYYSYGLIYKELKQFDLSIEYFNKINVEKYTEYKTDVAIEEANCTFRKKDYKEAIKKYYKILNVSIDKEIQAKCFRNLSESFLNIEQYENAKKYIDLCLDIRLKNKSRYTTENLRFAAIVYKDNFVKSKELLLLALKINNENSTKEQLLGLYLENNLEYKYIEPLLKKTKISNKTIINLSIYYFKTDNEKSYYFLQKLKNNI